MFYLYFTVYYMLLLSGIINSNEMMITMFAADKQKERKNKKSSTVEHKSHTTGYLKSPASVEVIIEIMMNSRRGCAWGTISMALKYSGLEH